MKNAVYGIVVSDEDVAKCSRDDLRKKGWSELEITLSMPENANGITAMRIEAEDDQTGVFLSIDKAELGAWVETDGLEKFCEGRGVKYSTPSWHFVLANGNCSTQHPSDMDRLAARLERLKETKETLAKMRAQPGESAAGIYGESAILASMNRRVDEMEKELLEMKEKDCGR